MEVQPLLNNSNDNADDYDSDEDTKKASNDKEKNGEGKSEDGEGGDGEEEDQEEIRLMESRDRMAQRRASIWKNGILGCIILMLTLALVRIGI